MSKKTEKVAVYIDGSNFYKYLKDKKSGFKTGDRFNYSKFVDFLARNRKCVSKRYYVGIARNFDNSVKSRKIVRGQQKFLAGLENEGFAIKRGRLMYDEGDIREKGTDVKIAVDLMAGATANLYDTAILVSSDTDLVPALKHIRQQGKKLEYVGFSHSPSFGMQKNADFSILLRPQDIQQLSVKR